jgi:hypothetical protein
MCLPTSIVTFLSLIVSQFIQFLSFNLIKLFIIAIDKKLFLYYHKAEAEARTANRSADLHYGFLIFTNGRRFNYGIRY